MAAADAGIVTGLRRREAGEAAATPGEEVLLTEVCLNSD